MGIIKHQPQNVRFGVKAKRAEQRHNFFVFIKPLILLFCVGSLYYFYTNWYTWLEKLDERPIAHIALQGSPRFTNVNDIREILAKMKLKGYFGQDVTEVRKQIQTMPWVKGVVVRKIWPDKLSIWVSEYQPVALWNGTEFVSSQGKVFQMPMDKLDISQFPSLFGADFQSLEVLDAWNKIGKALNAKNLVIKSLGEDERGAWEVRLDNDVVLKLGRGEWKSKIERLATIYPQIEVPEDKKLSYIDLRYNVGAAVGFENK